MISVGLARHLRDAGLRWTPARGDRFIVVDRDMDDDVFVLSDMTVELHHLPEGDLIGFNGTTEWALDAVEPDDALWLPGEAQLRERLGGSFTRLERDDGRWWITLRVSDDEHTVAADDAAEAYGLALAYLITGDDFRPGA